MRKVNGMKDWINRHFEEHLALLKELAAIPAPSHNEDRRAEFLLNWLGEHGFDAYEDGAKNVIVPMGCEGKDGIALYLAHTDVVFPDVEPLPVFEEGGRLYAPGVGDNTADIAAMLTMLRYIGEKGLKPKEPVIFAFNSCEEGLGNLKGIRQIMRDYEGRIREVISFDCSMDEGMIVRAVGSERWRVTCETCGGHSFGAFGNPNAIRHMAGLIDKLYEQEVPTKPGCRTTYNAGVIEGGTTINSIAQKCVLLYEYRSDDRECMALMRESFMKLLHEADCEKACFTAELIGERPSGGEVDEKAQDDLLDRCRRAIVSATGLEPAMNAGSTDANIPLSVGVPAVTFGLLLGEGAHTREEWLEIESLKVGLEIGLNTVLGHFE